MRGGIISLIITTLPLPRELELQNNDVIIDLEYSTKINLEHSTNIDEKEKSIEEPELCERIGLAYGRTYISVTFDKHPCLLRGEGQPISREDCYVFVNGFSRILLKKNRRFYAWNTNAEVQVFKSFGIDPPTINELMPDDGPRSLDAYIEDRGILEKFPYLRNWRSRKFLTRVVNDCIGELKKLKNKGNFSDSEGDFLISRLTDVAYGASRLVPHAGEIISKMISIGARNEVVRLYTSIATCLRNYLCIHAACFRYHEMRKEETTLNRRAIGNGKPLQARIDDFVRYDDYDFLEALAYKPNSLLIYATMVVEDGEVQIIAPVMAQLYEYLEFKEFLKRIEPSIEDYSREVIDLVERKFNDP